MTIEGIATEIVTVTAIVAGGEMDLETAGAVAVPFGAETTTGTEAIHTVAVTDR